MASGSLLDALLQPDAEGDRGFRARLQEQSAGGLRLLGMSFLALAVFMGTMLTLMSVPAPTSAKVLIIPIMVIAAACIPLSRLDVIRRHARMVGCLAVGAI